MTTIENEPKPGLYAIMHGLLVRAIDGCNCAAGGTPESSYLHEPGCGYEPVVKVEQLDAVGEVLQAARAWNRDLSHEAAGRLSVAISALDAS